MKGLDARPKKGGEESLIGGTHIEALNGGLATVGGRGRGGVLWIC